MVYSQHKGNCVVYDCLINIQKWLFSGNCLLCTRRISSGNTFCHECEQSLPRPECVCRRCAAALPGPDAELICGQCLQHPPAFDRTWAVFQFAPPIDILIRRLKYHHKLDLARVLGLQLAVLMQQNLSRRPDVIMPVPLHPSRLRERGYNQSLELARPAARLLNVPIDFRSARRIRATQAQTNLPPKQRQSNVRGAFRTQQKLAGLHVAIVDDVMTTGHTVNALAECLREAKADTIDVWVIARA